MNRTGKRTGRLLVAVCGAALGAAAAAAQARPPALFNIYASVPMADPQYIRKGEAVRVKLMRCGMAVESDETRNFPALAPDLFVVVSGPHRSQQDARAALDKAKACGVDGYTRSSRRAGD
jgi:hypothetical protein